MNPLAWWRRRCAERECEKAENDYYTRVVTVSANAAALWETPMVFINAVEARIVNRRDDGSTEEVLAFRGRDGLAELERAVNKMLADKAAAVEAWG